MILCTPTFVFFPQLSISVLATSSLSLPLRWHPEPVSPFSVSCGCRWRPGPSGWLPSAWSEPVPAAASVVTSMETPSLTEGAHGGPSPHPAHLTTTPLTAHQGLTSLAFCLSRSCSGSSCRDRDCSRGGITNFDNWENVPCIYVCAFVFLAGTPIFFFFLFSPNGKENIEWRQDAGSIFFPQFFQAMSPGARYLGGLQENLPLLLLLPLLLHLIQLLKELELGAHVIELLMLLHLLVNRWTAMRRSHAQS